jgi:hypothetical protein
MVMAPRTRAFLMNLRQDGLLLPLGPLLTCKSKVLVLLVLLLPQRLRTCLYEAASGLPYCTVTRLSVLAYRTS